jgi:hypothetical protein
MKDHKHVDYSFIATVICLLIVFSPVVSAEERNFAKFWNSWSENEKVNFVWGYREGVRRTMLNAMQIFEPISTPFSAGSKSEQLARESHLRFEVEDVIPIITVLYADSENAHIELPDIISIAEMKLNGENIRQELEKSRYRQTFVTKEELEKLAPETPKNK